MRIRYIMVNTNQIYLLVALMQYKINTDKVSIF